VIQAHDGLKALWGDVVTGRKPRHLLKSHAEPVGENLLRRCSGESAAHDPISIADLVSFFLRLLQLGLFGSFNVCEEAFLAELGLAIEYIASAPTLSLVVPGNQEEKR
jgi:hypothetical protein